MQRRRTSKTLDIVRGYMMPHNQIYNLDQRDMIAKVSKRGLSTSGTQTQISENIRNRYTKRSLNEQEKYIAELKKQIQELEQQKENLAKQYESQNGSLIINELYVSQDVPDVINRNIQQHSQSQQNITQERNQPKQDTDVHKNNISRIIAKRTQTQQQSTQSYEKGTKTSPFQNLIKNINDYLGINNSSIISQQEQQLQYNKNVIIQNNQPEQNQIDQIQNNYQSQQISKESDNSFPQMRLYYQSDSNTGINENSLSQSKGNTQLTYTQLKQFSGNVNQHNIYSQDSFIDTRTTKQIINESKAKAKNIQFQNQQQQLYDKKEKIINPVSISSDNQLLIQTQSQQIHHNQYNKYFPIEFEPYINQFYNMKAENNIYDLQNRALAKGNIKSQLINVIFANYVNNIQSEKFCVCQKISTSFSQNSKRKKSNKATNNNRQYSNESKQLLIALEHKSFNISFQSLGQQSLLDDETINLIGYYICVVKNSQIIQNTKQFLKTQKGRKAALEFVKNNRLCFYLDSQTKSSQSLMLKQSQKYQQLLKIVHEQLYKDNEIADILCQRIDIYAFLCENRHWIGFCYDGEIIHYFDGLNLSNINFETIENFLKLINGNSIQRYQRLEIPKQQNSYDCGIYCLLTMLQRTFQGNNFNIYMYASLFREWIVKSILLFGQ